MKLRAQWGLPSLRFVEPAGARGAVADLEALTGHAVVLDDTRLLPHWNVPEDFAAAVCVPVASPGAILGTFWLFCHKVRDFTAAETQLLEILAGRLAAELERSVLVGEVARASSTKRQAERYCAVAPGSQPSGSAAAGRLAGLGRRHAASDNRG